MNSKLGLQLYSLRNEFSVDFDTTLEAISCMGFEVVELAGLHFREPREFALKLQQYNLKPVSMHCDVLTSEGLNRSLKEAEILNCDYLVCPRVETQTFSSEKSISQLADKLNSASVKIRTIGKTLSYHNHDFEFQSINGEQAFDLFVALLTPDIKLQLDVYNTSIASVDPIEIFSKYSDRINMLHLKDGNISPSKPNVVVGSGNMDYITLLKRIPETVQWQFIEFEACNSGIWDAIIKSKEFCEKN